MISERTTLIILTFIPITPCGGMVYGNVRINKKTPSARRRLSEGYG